MNNQTEQTNRANQLNPNNDAYWQARGYSGRPKDWKQRLQHAEKPQRRS